MIGVLFALALQGAPVSEAPSIVGALTQETVEIRSDFAGADLVLYGATRGLRITDDIVVAVRGPSSDLRVMRKERLFGVWVNSDPVVFENVPGYYAIASTRSIGEIATEDALDRNELGLTHIAAPDPEDADLADIGEYAEAIARLRGRVELFAQASTGVEVLDGGLFRAAVRLPPETPVGDYVAEVYLFRDGRPVASRFASLRVEKAGIERTIFAFAYDHPMLYGLWAVALAMFAGWAANAAFSRR